LVWGFGVWWFRGGGYFVFIFTTKLRWGFEGLGLGIGVGDWEIMADLSFGGDRWVCSVDFMLLGVEMGW
jgi:hypothetical protein